MASMDDEAGYEIETYGRYLVSTYTGLNFLEVNQLNYVDYLRYRRDAYIQRCSSTPEGKEFLRECRRMEQTKPDRDKLRRITEKGGKT